MDFSKWQSVAITRRARLLETGPLYRFRDWPCQQLPEVAAGVYTVWEGSRLLYVGQAGARWSGEDMERFRNAGVRKGLYTRMRSHISGRRNGDAFCLGICDHLVLPRLSQSEIEGIAAGSASLDSRVRAYLSDHCGYRFELFNSGSLIPRIVSLVRQGRLEAGKPLINPGTTTVIKLARVGQS